MGHNKPVAMLAIPEPEANCTLLPPPPENLIGCILRKAVLTS